MPTWYDPLHDDAQAMALVKRFKKELDEGGLLRHELMMWAKGERSDLNRAICECLAKLQEGKG